MHEKILSRSPMGAGLFYFLGNGGKMKITSPQPPPC